MGCDIHMIAEQRDRTGLWEPMLVPMFKNRSFRENDLIDHWNEPYQFEPYDDRNYELFSVLADVRNSWDILPISKPRGYPDDLHVFSKWLLDEWVFAEHSPTWLALDEVLDYNWDVPSKYGHYKTLRESASVFLENIELLKQYGESEGYDIRLVFGFDN